MTGPSDDHDAGGAGTFGVDEARALAAVAHAGQLDKGGHPYLGHVERVAEAVAPRGAHAVMAALLHDVVEDCGLGLADLEAKGVPVEVVSAVDALTKRAGEPYLDAVRRAARHPLAAVVKRADNADNADEGRLARLDAAEAERLRQKYRRARAVLDAEEVEAD
ncbi:MAG: HD domain-containing protein [Actinobacteria bacterium]|nr:HD domain-containing protein [Actinomycetota bacterium]